MTSDKAAALVNTLYARTKEGQVAWSQTSNDDAFEFALPEYTIRIARQYHENEQDEATYYLNLLDSNGKSIDTVFPFEVTDHFRNAWEIFATLFNRARDRGLGISTAVDRILAELGGEVPLENVDDEIPF